MKIEIGNNYKIALVDPLFSDWIGVIALCARQVNGLFEMHANGAYIYCEAGHLQRTMVVKKCCTKRKAN